MLYVGGTLSGLLGLALCQTVQANDIQDCTGAEAIGDQCMLKVTDIHPTQFSVGSVAVNCKAAKIEKKKESLADLQKYLANPKRWVPAAIGPDGQFYITDHHHLSTALYRAKNDEWTGRDQQVRATILANFIGTGVSMDEFWNILSMQKNVWPYDENGQPVENYGEKLATMDLEDLKDNPYRTLSRWTRESCGYVKSGKDQCTALEAIDGSPTAPYFMEFYWARYLRTVAFDGDNGPFDHAQLQAMYPKAIKNTLKKKKTTQYFQDLGLDAEQYGQNQEGTYLHLKFTDKSCEQWWLDKGDGA